MIFKWFQYIDTLALILSLVFFADLKKFRLAGFSLLVFLVCITEMFASNYLAFGWKSNYAVYNYYMVYSTIVIFFVFGRMLNYKGIVKKVFIGASILATLLVVCNLLFVQGLSVYNTYSSVMTSFFWAILSMLVICKLFLEEDNQLLLIENPYFWIAGGTLIFSLGGMVTMGLHQYVLLHKIQIGGKNIYRIIMPPLSASLYSSYCIAFILCRKLTTRYS